MFVHNACSDLVMTVQQQQQVFRLLFGDQIFLNDRLALIERQMRVMRLEADNLWRMVRDADSFVKRL